MLKRFTGLSISRNVMLVSLAVGLISLSACSAFSQHMTQNTAGTASVSAEKSHTGNPQIAAVAIQDYFEARYAKNSANTLESQLSALGASAGFGTQMAIREGFIKTGKVPENKAFVVVQTSDNSKYFFGDFLNHGLFEGADKQITVWSLVGGAAQKAGATTLPDIVEIVKYNADTIGTSAFGVPRLPVNHQPQELPRQVLQKTWADVRSILESKDIDPTLWGWVSALAAQKVIIQNKDKIEPAFAAKIVMESALPMSKMDPQALGIPY